MEKRPTVWQTGIKFGLITGLILTVYSLILYFLELTSNTWLNLISFIILIIGLVYAHWSFKTNGNGFMSYGQGLGIGTIVAGVSGILSSLFSYIYVKFINPDYMANVLEEQRIALEDQGFDDEQIDQALAIFEAFRTPEVSLLTGIIFMIIFGFILSLIVSAFTKKTDPALDM
jgi:hypothetical protein